MAPDSVPHRSTRYTGFLLLLSLLLVWEWSARSWVSSANWPPITEIARSGFSSIASGELPEVFLSSLSRMLAGYGIGVVLAIGLGLLMAGFRLMRAALEPLVELLRPIPIPAIVPPLILILGIDDAMKIFVVAFSVFFPVLINTIAGVRSVDPISHDVARTFQMSRAATVLKVVLPASLPYIMAGMRISLALALIVTVVAEMIAGSKGIGYYLVTMQYAMRAGDMYAAIFLLAGTGYLLNRGILIGEHKLLHWFHRS
ncbi:ABC transporter permease [Polaromonas sp.]|uniref:ABC transporter permease n=1 Tax=Polaromonas sp. TaxID=1869339 RepID=UPI00356720F0